jgi:outer membrane protein OmpA-like peptidoglycan-associated protein
MRISASKALVLLRLAAAGMLLVAASCATPPVTTGEEELTIDQAVSRLADSLSKQLRDAGVQAAGTAAPGSSPKGKFFAIDRITDARTGQSTVLTQDLRQRVGNSLGSTIPGAQLGLLDRENLGKADFVIAGALTHDRFKGEERRFRLQLSVVDLKTGLVTAHDAVWLKGDYDMTPELFYRDSPIVPRDQFVDAQSATARAKPGQHADSRYLDQLPTGAVLNDAESAYNAGNSDEAARLFAVAANRSDGKTLRAYSGLYLANTRLGRKPESEAAFSGLVREGITNNQLSIRFLFKVGSTEFVEDPLHGQQYPMWLRQLAQNFWKSKDCVEVSGHSSHTGSGELNERLSAYRAEAVLRFMMLTEPRLQAKIKAVGKGFRENIVGTGADDASDAVDRRVEFKVVACT